MGSSGDAKIETAPAFVRSVSLFFTCLLLRFDAWREGGAI